MCDNPQSVWDAGDPISSAKGEEARSLDEQALLSNSLPVGRGESENAAEYAEYSYEISQFPWQAEESIKANQA
jgi:hypothetical protein